MVPREQALPVEKRIHSRRQASGLSRQELAWRCGMTRQAMITTKAGHHVTNILVAIRMPNRVAELSW
jgi:DNA-binding XRE family transcriptional regulator